MKANLMSCISDCSTVLGEALQGVAGNEPSGFDFVFLEEL